MGCLKKILELFRQQSVNKMEKKTHLINDVYGSILNNYELWLKLEETVLCWYPGICMINRCIISLQFQYPKGKL